MRTDHHTPPRLYRLLSPLAFLYGIGVSVRNRLFDWGLLRSESFDVPVICVGNLAVGGTGKTPHTEYLIRQLRTRHKIAVLSRGYKRKTRGFVLAHPGSTSQEIGDEPYQIWRKFPDITVAVDADRRRGIRSLLALPATTRPDVILLDDAFQHRYVRASLNIVLTDSHRLYSLDKLLPVGRLREPASGIRRADAVIVTKCEPDLLPADFQSIKKNLSLGTTQKLFFSRVVYGDLEPVFPAEAPPYRLSDMGKDDPVLLVSGIAHPEYFQEEIRKQTNRVTSLAFPDHHAFGKEDIQRIQSILDRPDSPGKRIIVTEKDAARLRDHPLLPAQWHGCLYQLPITIGILQEQEREFNEWIDKQIITLKRNHIAQ